MKRRYGYVLTAAVMVASAGIADAGPFKELGRVFAPPVDVIKKSLQGKSPALQPEQAKPTATGPAADEEPAEAEKAANAGDVPLPTARPTRPGETIAEEAVTKPEEPPVMALAPVDEPAVAPTPPLGGGATAEVASLPAAPQESFDFDERFGGLNVGRAAADVPLPRLRSPAAARLAALAVEPGSSGSDCRRSLQALGIVSVSIDPISNGRCGIAAPAKISALGGGNVALTQSAVLSCRAAERLAAWMKNDVQPAARDRLGGSVTGIRVAASYHCRTRNGVAGAKLSEHAVGNAIDISAFEVAGVGWIEVGNARGFAARRFLSDIRTAACGPFTTVLGPGSDKYHDDHFHLDVVKRGKSGNSLYCK